MPLNREHAALSIQNLYLPRDAIYAQKDSKDQGRIERCCWSNVAAEIYYNCASFIGRYAWHESCPEVINHDVTLITTRKINDLHDITITTIFNLWIWSNFSISLFFQIYISCSIRPIHRHFSLIALRFAPFKNLFKTFDQNSSKIAEKFINISKTSLLFLDIFLRLQKESGISAKHVRAIIYSASACMLCWYQFA